VRGAREESEMIMWGQRYINILKFCIEKNNILTFFEELELSIN
jgi:hypothetical protein